MLAKIIKAIVEAILNVLLKNSEKPKDVKYAKKNTRMHDDISDGITERLRKADNGNRD